MKKLFTFILALSLATCCRAGLYQVTTLSTSTVKTILNPAASTHLIIFQNLGTAAVNLTIDGGTTYTNPGTQTTGTDPTTSATGLGLVVPPMANGIPGSLTINAPRMWTPIRAIMQTGTTTLNIITDGYGDGHPTS